MKKGILNIIFILLFIQAVNAQIPVANFSGSVLSGCAPLSVNFKDLSTGDPKYWDWEFADGGSFSQLSNLQNPSVTFSQPGTYSVTLVVRNQNGVNAVTKTDYITVYPSPVVSFVADVTTACLPASIQFTGTASTTVGTISEWAWDFGDGTTSNLQNPQHTYTETGYFNVALTVTSSNGCSRRVSRSRYIRMVSGIVADFVNTPSANCKPPFTIDFSNESSGPGQLSYTWDFGNGHTANGANPVANYTTDGDYSVQLITQSSYGCKDTVQKTVTVKTFTGGFNSPDSICLVESVNFVNTSVAGASSILWDFGDGTQSTELNPVKTYGSIGDYTVTLINDYGHCSDSVSNTIRVTPKAPVDFTATNNLGCGTPLTVSFQNNTPGAVSWFWDFGDGHTSTDQNPVHVYTTVTSYDVKLTVSTANGCGNTIVKPGFVKVIPTTVKIIPDIDKGCVNLTTVNPAAQIRTIDAIDSYLWNFGDGTTSSLPAPTHTYNTVGVFNMTVTVTTVDGCSVTASHPVEVGIPPSGADFTFDNSSGDCTSDTVKFYATAVGANEWLWDFGDGVSSIEQNPAHLYRDTGNFSVKLTPFNNGCSGLPVIKTNIIYKDAPVANFKFSVDCSNPLIVNFTDSSIVDSGLGNISYYWNFGDGKSSTDKDPGSHTYPSSGQYNVQLTVTNGACTSYYSRQINLFAPNPDFTLPTVALCKNTQFTFQSVEDTSKIVSYTWLVDGLAVRNEYIFDTVFQTPGSRNLKLVVIDENGCTATEEKILQVKSPDAKFTSQVAANCGMDAVVFTDQTTSGTPVAEWLWDFGDGVIQSFTSTPFTHKYADTGSYKVKLIVKDTDGCIDAFTLAHPVKVSAPKAYFGAAQTLFCPGLPLAFNDSSRGKGLTHLWSFGDNQTSTDQNPSHIYADGKYTVSLIVTDSEGCSDTLTRNDYIDVRTPVAAFEARDTSSTCQLLESKFYNKSQNFESFYWDFGDSTNSTLAEPKHFYDVYGNYVVKLFVKGYGGCIDSAVGQVNVYDPVAFTKINYTVPSLICNEIALDFNFTVPPGTRYQFAFGDGKIDSSGQTSLSHFYNYPNTYRPSVTLVDSLDCRVSVSGPVAINVKGAVPAFNIDKKQFCDSGIIFVTNYTISNETVDSYIWDFGDAQTSTDKSPSPHIFQQAGLYPVSLTATTQSGCSKTYIDTVRVYRTPVPVIVADDMICLNRAIVFNGLLAQPDTGILWNWSFGDGKTSTEINNTITYSAPGSYNVTLSAANQFGCRDVATHALNVAPLPVITTKNVVMPVGGAVVMPVSYSSGVANYFWSPPDGLNCTSCPAPQARPNFTTTYQVQVTDSNSCTANAEILVEVVCKEENYYVPNTFSPNGDGMNDVFFPRGRGLARVQSMKIYNRWGQLVFDKRNFSANDPSSGWNGKLNNQRLPPDVYVYLIEFVCENAQIIPMKGNVTLIR